MTRHRLRAWLWFAATAVPLLLVVGWLTRTLCQLDRDELHARQQAALHEKLRLALWRMDSWLSPQLAREASRPSAEYRSFAPAPNAWTRGYSKLAPDEVLVPSPLLGFESPSLLLHFEIQPDGSLTSPQVPQGNQRDVAEANGVDAAVLARAEQRLAEFGPRLQLGAVARVLGDAEALLPLIGCTTEPEQGQQVRQSVAEYSNRALWNFEVNQQNAVKAPPPETGLRTPLADTVGPMVPFWLDGNEPVLALGRRVQGETGTRMQGVVLAWPVLARQMCDLAGDLFERDCMRLVRCEHPDPAQQASMLASVPARLEARLVPVAQSGLPTGTMLAITWGVTLLGLTVLALTLRAAIGFGERRARFASAVTHELRTPLTTFRMYSEMLADGVVTEPKARQEYLATLQRESDRLARVVENVLAWSRLEEGRFTSRRQRHAAGDLVAAIEPVLRRRLVDADMDLQIAFAGDAAAVTASTDEDAVGQILFNLVDNAAKHAANASPRCVELHVSATDDTVRLAVRDHGPGVAPAHRRGIFAPFDRGALPTGSNDVPGVGLGLPLARGLARDLGGDLELADDGGPGACFVLTLPRA